MSMCTTGEKLYNYNIAEHIDGAKAVKIFLEEAFKTNDAGHIAHVLGLVAKSKGMAEIAEKTGLSKEQLYKTLNTKDNTTLKTLLSVLTAMGFEIVPRRDIS